MCNYLDFHQDVVEIEGGLSKSNGADQEIDFDEGNSFEKKVKYVFLRC